MPKLDEVGPRGKGAIAGGPAPKAPQVSAPAPIPEQAEPVALAEPAAAPVAESQAEAPAPPPEQLPPPEAGAAGPAPDQGPRRIRAPRGTRQAKEPAEQAPADEPGAQDPGADDPLAEPVEGLVLLADRTIRVLPTKRPITLEYGQLQALDAAASHLGIDSGLLVRVFVDAGLAVIGAGLEQAPTVNDVPGALRLVRELRHLATRWRRAEEQRQEVRHSVWRAVRPKQ